MQLAWRVLAIGNGIDDQIVQRRLSVCLFVFLSETQDVGTEAKVFPRVELTIES